MYDTHTASYFYVSSFHCGVEVGMVRVIYRKETDEKDVGMVCRSSHKIACKL